MSDYYDDEESVPRTSYSGSTPRRALGNGSSLDRLFASGMPRYEPVYKPVRLPRVGAARPGGIRYEPETTLGWREVPRPEAVGLPVTDQTHNRPMRTFGTNTIERATPVDTYQPPGFPERISVTPFGDPNSLLAQAAESPWGPALGLVPGAEKGGFVEGPLGFPIATTPITIANAPSWGREGAAALISSILHGTGRYEQSAGALFGEQVEGPSADEHQPIDYFFDAANAVGDAIWAPFDAAFKLWENANAQNRAKGIREIAQTGRRGGPTIGTVLFLPALLGEVTSLDRDTMEEISTAAIKKGVSWEDMAAKLYDLDPLIVKAIVANPDMSDEDLNMIVEGQPLSTDPGVNILLSLGVQGAMLIAGGFAVKGLGAAAKAPRFLGGLGTAGNVATKTAKGIEALWRINSAYTLSGWTTRGGEWAIKEIAGLAGNQGVVDYMDRLLWEMPTSTNPGLNLIDGFGTHMLRRRNVSDEAGRFGGWVGSQLLHGQVYAGQGRSALGLDIGAALHGRGMKDILIAGERPVAALVVAGEEIATPQAVGQALARLRGVSLDTLNAKIFAKIGWEPEAVKAFVGDAPLGDGSMPALTLDELKNGLLYHALAEVRDRLGPDARALNPAVGFVEFSREFVQAHVKEGVKLLEDALLHDKAEWLVRRFQETYWNRGTPDASELGVVPMYGAFDGTISILQFRNWLTVSKLVEHSARMAREEGHAILREDWTLALSKAVSPEAVAAGKALLKESHALDEAVSARTLNRLRISMPSLVQHPRLAPGPRKRWAPKITRRELEKILDEVLAESDKRMADQARYPTGERAPITQDAIDKRNIQEMSAASGMTVDMLNALLPFADETIEVAEGARPNVPEIILRWAAEDMHRPYETVVRSPEAALEHAITVLDKRLADAVVRGGAKSGLEDFARHLRRKPGAATVEEAISRAVLALERPPKDDWLRVNRTPADLWQDTLYEAINFLGDDAPLGSWLDDPASAVNVAEINGRPTIIPNASSAADLRQVDELIPRFRALTMSEAQATILNDPTRPTWERLAAVIDLADQVDPPFTVDERALLATYAKEGPLLFDEELRAVLGAPESGTFTAADVATLEARAVARDAELPDLAGQVEQLANRIASHPGAGFSSDLDDFLRRARTSLGTTTVDLDLTPTGRVRAGVTLSTARGLRTTAKWEKVTVDPTPWTSQRVPMAARKVSAEVEIAKKKADLSVQVIRRLDERAARLAEGLPDDRIDWNPTPLFKGSKTKAEAYWRDLQVRHPALAAKVIRDPETGKYHVIQEKIDWRDVGPLGLRSKEEAIVARDAYRAEHPDVWGVEEHLQYTYKGVQHWQVRAGRPNRPEGIAGAPSAPDATAPEAPPVPEPAAASAPEPPPVAEAVPGAPEPAPPRIVGGESVDPNNYPYTPKPERYAGWDEARLRDESEGMLVSIKSKSVGVGVNSEIERFLDARAAWAIAAGGEPNTIADLYLVKATQEGRITVDLPDGTVARVVEQTPDGGATVVREEGGAPIELTAEDIPPGMIWTRGVYGTGEPQLVEIARMDDRSVGQLYEGARRLVDWLDSPEGKKPSPYPKVERNPKNKVGIRATHDDSEYRVRTDESNWLDQGHSNLQTREEAQAAADAWAAKRDARIATDQANARRNLPFLEAEALRRELPMGDKGIIWNRRTMADAEAGWPRWRYDLRTAIREGDRGTEESILADLEHYRRYAAEPSAKPDVVEDFATLERIVSEVEAEAGQYRPFVLIISNKNHPEYGVQRFATREEALAALTEEKTSRIKGSTFEVDERPYPNVAEERPVSVGDAVWFKGRKWQVAEVREGQVGLKPSGPKGAAHAVEAGFGPDAIKTWDTEKGGWRVELPERAPEPVRAAPEPVGPWRTAYSPQGTAWSHKGGAMIYYRAGAVGLPTAKRATETGEWAVMPSNASSSRTFASEAEALKFLARKDPAAAADWTARKAAPEAPAAPVVREVGPGDSLVITNPELLPSRPAGLEAIIADAKAKNDRLDALAAAGERPIEVPRSDGEGSILVGPDVRRPGMWMSGYIDKEGTPTGHVEADSYREALENVRGFADVEAIEAAHAAEGAFASGRGAETGFPDPYNETATIPATFRVMELDELISDDMPGYRTELQPRDREGRITSDEQVADMAQKMTTGAKESARLMLRTESGAEGAFVVDPNGQVIAGNGRARSMRVAGDPMSEAMKAALVKRAKEFGVDPDVVRDMKYPVLVREVPAELASPQLAAALNVATGGMAITETAGRVAAQITPEAVSGLELEKSGSFADALNSERGRAFAGNVLRILTKSEQKQYLDAKGNLNQQGVQLIQAATVAKLMRDPASNKIVAAFFETPDADVARIRSGLLGAMGQLLSSHAKIDAGIRYAQLRIGDALARATLTIMDLRGQGQGGKVLAQTLDSPAMFEDADAMFDRELARTLVALNSAPEVTTFLRAYAKAVEESADPAQIGMFEIQPSKLRIGNAAIKDINNAREAAANDAVAKRALADAKKGDGMGLVEPEVATWEAIRPFTDAETGDVSISEPVMGDTGIPHPPVMEGPAHPDLASAMDDAARRAEGAERVVFDEWIGHGTMPEGVPVTIRTTDPTWGTLLARLRAGERSAIAAELDEYLLGFLADTFDGADALLFAREASEGNLAAWLIQRHVVARTGKSPRTLADGTTEWNLTAAERRFPDRADIDASLDSWDNAASRPSDLAVVGPDDLPLAMLRQTDAVIAGAEPKLVDPGDAGRTGLPPDVEATVRAADLDGTNAHVVATDADAHLAAALKAKAGALPTPPNPNHPRVLEFHKPDLTARLLAIESERIHYIGELDQAQRRLEEISGTPTEDVPWLSEDPQMADIYARFVYGGIPESADPWLDFPETPAPPALLPNIIGMVDSIDKGVHPGIDAAEASALRAEFMALAERTLEKAGGEPSSASLRRLERAHAALRTARERGEPIEVITDPVALPAALDNLASMLAGKMENFDADPLDGFTGYQLGILPRRSRFDRSPLSPRIQYRDLMGEYKDLIDAAEATVPGLGDELLGGPIRTFAKHVADARFSKGITQTLDMLFGPRSERMLAGQAIQRWKDDIFRLAEPLGANIDEIDADLDAIVKALHEYMMETSVLKLPQYRRVNSIFHHDFNAVAERTLKERGGSVPPWFEVVQAQPEGLAGIWRKADNRFRAFLADRSPGFATDMDRLWFNSRVGRKGGSIRRGLVVGYNLWRFTFDARWQALEYLESDFLLLGRDGLTTYSRYRQLQGGWRAPKSKIQGSRGGVSRRRDVGAQPGVAQPTSSRVGGAVTPDMMPPMWSALDRAKARQSWAWWASQTDEVGLFTRSRDNAILAAMRKEAPEAFEEELIRWARQDPLLQDTLKSFGETPEQWVERLSRDWEAFESITDPTVWARLKQGGRQKLLDRYGKELAGKDTAALAAKEAYPVIPEIERAIAETRGDARVVAMYERLRDINNELYDDLAAVFYGQPDRSNMQRILNHPLLYWPISYQIKSTKWLARIMFDKAFGVETGFGGALVIQKIHDDHVERWRRDPAYREAFEQHRTLLFMAQMLLPITPFDIGVSLSPFTKYALHLGQADEYSRNIFAIGPGYSYFSLFPRVFFEENKPGGIFGEGAPAPMQFIGNVGEQVQPFTIKIKPASLSTSDEEARRLAAEQQLIEDYGPPASNPTRGD